MRPIFCGNFEYDARQSDLERIFGRYGKVDRVDMKSGFAFIYMDDEHDAADAIRGLDRSEFGKHGRRLRVEWTKQERERGIRRPAGARRSSGNLKPTKTLFVINFDPVRTRTRDLEAHFDPFGKILNIRIKRNFAFVQFELQEDATKALEATNLSKVMDRVISVEYAVRDDDDKRNGYSPVRRGRERSSERSRDRGRSPSPYGRAERGSPDYGRGSSPRGRVEQRGSPDYGRGPSPRGRVERRGSPDYGRGPSPRGRSEQRGSPDYGHGPSPRGRIEQRGSPDYGHGSSPLGRAEQRDSPEYGHSPSPPGRPEKRGSPNYERGPSPRGRPEKRGSPNYERSPSPRGRSEKRVSPDYERGLSPHGRPEKRGSPDYD